MASQVTLTTSLEAGQSACLEEIVIFTCVVNGSRILSWNSTEYIGTGGAKLQFSKADDIGARLNSTVNPHTFATLMSPLLMELPCYNLNCILHPMKAL